MKRQILHVDVNNAFLSWSAVDMLNKGKTLDIRNIPSVIGGDEDRRSGIVLAKSMKAKQFGIVTGETLYSARKKCPGLKTYPVNHKLYTEYSNKLYELLLCYTEKIERFSVDECFLDMTEYLMNDKLINKAQEIRKRVKDELGFTVNIGVSSNKLLAKMASDFTKPDKVHTLYEEEIKEKMWTLPISDLFMIGRKTLPKLYNMQIKTIGDLAKKDKNVLIKKFGKHGLMIWEYANGIDDTEVKYKKELPKCIGNSVTLPRDVLDKEIILEIILSLTEQVTFRLRKYDLLASVVNIQLRTKDFEDFSHQGKLDIATSNTKEIYQKSKTLLEEMYKPKTPIRLVGVRVSKLTSRDEVQLSLFSTAENKKQEKVDRVLDDLRRRYGYNSVTKAGKMNVDKNISK